MSFGDEVYLSILLRRDGAQNKNDCAGEGQHKLTAMLFFEVRAKVLYLRQYGVEW
jgi:hypothetical protein